MPKPSEIDSLILEVMEKCRPIDGLRGIEKLPDFRKVVAEYLKHSPDEAPSRVECMISHYGTLYMRIQMHRHEVAGIELDENWQQTQKDWTPKRTRLVKLLCEAADLFDSGQCEAGPYSSLTGYKEIDAEHQTVDEITWCGSENLKRWAGIVDTSPVEVVFPVARPQPAGLVVPHESIKNIGGATNPDSAFRGMIVRETARYVPETTLYNYAVISNLVKFLGQDGVNRNYVRSLLLGGHT